MVIAEAFFGLQIREEFEDLVTLRIAHAFQRVIAGLEAFGPGTVRQHDLVAVTHEVNIADTDRLDLVDAVRADKMLGRDQHFMLVEVKLGAVIGNEQTVVRRDQHVTLGQTIAKTVRLDQNRLQVAVNAQLLPGQGLFTDPADLLDAVVAGDHPVTGAQLLDRHFTTRRRDQRAGGKAGDDILDIAEVEMTNLIAVTVQEMDAAVFRVFLVIDDAQRAGA